MTPSASLSVQIAAPAGSNFDLSSLFDMVVDGGPLMVLAVAGDMVLMPAFSARDALEQSGIRVRIVSIASPRRLYPPGDLGWNTVSEPDGRFMDDETFAGLFHGDALLAISGGPSATLEPVLLRSSVRRDVLCWQRGETVASPAELMHFNGVDAPTIEARAKALLGL